MKKYLIWTVLVLAAITACNKEIDTPAPIVDNGQEEVTPGKITLTFTAAIGDETRTAYDDEQKPDQKARWVIGDKITVCVSNGDESNPVFKLFDFTATTQSDNNMIFSGEVVEGYTTIVSGIYPARTSEVQTNGEVTSYHSFSNGIVSQVYLPNSYSLGSSNDLGDAIPMVGKIENDAFTFRHICGALKIEIIDIFDALTFTTNNEAITGSFSLSGGRIATAASSGPSTVTFNYGRLSTNPPIGERDNRTFYIPIPDGNLTANATMKLKKRNTNNTLTTVYQKSTSGAIGFNSNVIKRLQAIGLTVWDNYSITMDKSGSNPVITYTVDNNVHYLRQFISLQKFNSDCKGSVAGLIELYLSNNGQTGETKLTLGQNAQYYYQNGPEYKQFIIGVNQVEKTGRLITFEYYCQDFVFPDMTNEYNSWIGSWTVPKSNTENDTWTITSKATGTYSVSGLCGRSFPVEAHLTGEGNLIFKTQRGFGQATTSTGYQASLCLYRRQTANGTYNSEKDLDLMMATQSETNGITTASLSPSDATYPYYTIIGTYTNSQGESKAVGYGTRSASVSSMTKQ